MKRTSGKTIAWTALVLLIAPTVAALWVLTGHDVPRLAAQELLLRLGLYAVLEEIVFRGALQPWLTQRPALRDHRWMGITAANALTSLSFALAHGIVQSPMQAAAVLPVSLLFGLALEHSRRLAAPIALHLYFNGLLWAASWILARA